MQVLTSTTKNQIVITMELSMDNLQCRANSSICSRSCISSQSSLYYPPTPPKWSLRSSPTTTAAPSSPRVSSYMAPSSIPMSIESLGMLFCGKRLIFRGVDSLKASLDLVMIPTFGGETFSLHPSQTFRWAYVHISWGRNACTRSGAQAGCNCGGSVYAHSKENLEDISLSCSTDKYTLVFGSVWHSGSLLAQWNLASLNWDWVRFFRVLRHSLCT